MVCFRISLYVIQRATFRALPLYIQTFTFIFCAAAAFSIFRLAFALWHYDRVRKAGGLRPILIGGIRIDLKSIGIAVVVPLLLAPWLNANPVAQAITSAWFTTAWAALILLEVSTPQFIIEYDTRPNRLFIDYLKHPKEVSGMLWKGYKLSVLLSLTVMTLLVLQGHEWFDQPAVRVEQFSALEAAGLSFAAAIVCFLAIRGTLRHRPINPSMVAYCGDSLLNTLPVNSIYNVIYAIYSIKNERSAASAYGSMDDTEVHQRVLSAAGLPHTQIDSPIPSSHFQQASRQHERPLNVVLIVEESLGAQYVGNLGGSGMTPCLDALAKTGWNFARAYATGTRSVRGLEAVSAGFPPTLSDAVLRLSGSQQRFFTLPQLLKPLGYRSHFIYGGEAHFDNMKSFFMGNGFDELHEQAQFTDPAFVGTWGVSDEDMFSKLHDVLEAAGDTPVCTLAFSVSNHSPWEYPSGRIDVQGNPATVQNTVRYADWALGNFFEKARTSDYWDNTVFLIVADHDSRVGGASLVPLKHFHIPALILGGTIAPRRDERIISQIDLPVTLLSLMGISSTHPMIGHDLTNDSYLNAERAMMQYGENYGYLKNDVLTVLEPGRKVNQYRYQAPDQYTPLDIDKDLADEALAHALWPTLVYKQRAYTLDYLLPEGASALGKPA